MLREMAVQSLASQSRTNGQWDGQNRGFIAVYHVGGAPEVAKAYVPCIADERVGLCSWA
jgi:hypothetical protein